MTPSSRFEAAVRTTVKGVRSSWDMSATKANSFSAKRRAAAHGHDEDVGVAVVVAGEGHQRAVRREARIGLGARKAGQAQRVAAVAADHPEVIGVGEGDLRVTDRGLAQQTGSLGGTQGGEKKNQGQTRGRADPVASPG